jgi:hypothetical protein
MLFNECCCSHLYGSYYEKWYSLQNRVRKSTLKKFYEIDPSCIGALVIRSVLLVHSYGMVMLYVSKSLLPFAPRSVLLPGACWVGSLKPHTSWLHLTCWRAHQLTSFPHHLATQAGGKLKPQISWLNLNFGTADLTYSLAPWSDLSPLP